MSLSTRSVSYGHLGKAFTGFLVADDAQHQPRPGILLVHGGSGLDDHAKGQAHRYAALGYVVLACDMFGEGVAGDRERVIARLKELRDDPDLMSGTAEAGVNALSACAEVSSAIAAIGFCFGGLVTLTLARSGADLPGVVSIHGSLATQRPAEPGSVRAKVLACHGALDPHVPLGHVVEFASEMERANADWQLVMYGRAMHGFTHVGAVPGAIPGVAYDAPADERSFAAVREFLTELAPH